MQFFISQQLPGATALRARWMRPGLHLSLRFAFPERGCVAVVNRPPVLLPAAASHATRQYLPSSFLSPSIPAPPPPPPSPPVSYSSFSSSFYLAPHFSSFSPPQWRHQPSGPIYLCVRQQLEHRGSQMPAMSPSYTHTLRGYALTKQPENKSHHNL